MPSPYVVRMAGSSLAGGRRQPMAKLSTEAIRSSFMAPESEAR
jgi:hypothetical protein